MAESPIRYVVIVHPAGVLDRDDDGYWAEVVELPSCMAEATTEHEVVEMTQANIRRLLEDQASGFETQLIRAM